MPTLESYHLCLSVLTHDQSQDESNCICQLVYVQVSLNNLYKL